VNSKKRSYLELRDMDGEHDFEFDEALI
jgi:hypothetical protein